MEKPPRSKRMANEDDKFRVTNVHIPSGTAYLKVLLLRFAIETNTKTYHIRQMLQDLSKKMRTVKNVNIDEFNQFTHQCASHQPRSKWSDNG